MPRMCRDEEEGDQLARLSEEALRDIWGILIEKAKGEVFIKLLKGRSAAAIADWFDSAVAVH